MPTILIDLRNFRPGIHRRAELLDQMEIMLLPLIGFRLAGDRFTKHVDREGPLEPALAQRSGQHLAGIGSGDEPPGVIHRVPPGDCRQTAATQRRGCRHHQAEPRRRRQPVANIFQIFLQMPGDRLRRGEHRQHVDEAEQLHFDRFVVHGPRHDPIVPPAAIERVGAAAIQMIEQIAPDFLRAALDGLQIGGRKIAIGLRLGSGCHCGLRGEFEFEAASFTSELHAGRRLPTTLYGVRPSKRIQMT